MSETRKIRVLIVDDHPLMRVGVAAIIDGQATMMTVAQAGTGEEAVELYEQHRPDVTLMDLRLPRMSGVEAIRTIRRRHPQARFVVLTTYEGDEDIHQALEVGTQGYIIKGMPYDLLLQALPGILARGGQLALLGSGDPLLEGGFTAAATSRPDSIGCVLGYDEKLAHLIQAGADFIVVPSRFEPCGLTQLCALRYGAPPIVARVGGLADTVIDANEAATAAGVATGVQFYPPAVESLTYALNRALDIARDPAVLRRLRLNGMRSDVSWRGPAKRYAALYREIIRPAE